MGSTLRNLTAAGIATSGGMRRSASSWFSVVVPSQTCGQPSPQSVGSMSLMFCGLFVSKNQMSAGVERMSDHKSVRHDVGTLLSKTSAMLAQKTRRRVPSTRARSFQRSGPRQ
jgi:hypothetical protein